MPPELHAEVAQAAERRGTSLNGFIISSLTASVGGAEDDRRPDPPPVRDNARLVTWLLVANVVAVSLVGLAAVVILLVAA